MTEAWVGLAEAVKAIRAELDTAMDEGAGEKVQFEVGPIELEFAVDVQKAAEVDAGVRVWVVSLGGKGSLKRDSANRIKVVLKPTVKGHKAKISSDRDAAPPKRTRSTSLSLHGM